MAWTSLGRVAVPSPGTPVSAVTNVNPAATYGQNQKYYACLALLFQADRANIGQVFIGNAGFNKTTRTGMLITLGIPTVNSVPSGGATIPNAAAALNAGDYWIDADQVGDAVVVSILIA